MLHWSRPPDPPVLPKLRNNQRGHDMTNATTAGEKYAESALESGTAAMKTGLEKALKGYDAFVGYSKGNAEAVTEAATTAGKSAESISNEIYSYSKQSIENAVAATKAVMGSKSVH